MNTAARFEMEITAEKPGEEDGEDHVVKRTAKMISTELLLGDGKAEVGWTTPIRISSKYARVVVGGTAHVSLHCNQDDETIVSAIKLCKTITNKAMKSEYPKLKALLIELNAEILRETGSQQEH